MARRRTGIAAIYRRANRSRRHPAHPVFPYLLRRLVIDRPNQVWAADVTYIPMARGFVYLVAVSDWYTRKILAWRLSNSLTADFCVEALEEALQRFGRPEIFNTDQDRSLPAQISSAFSNATASASAWMVVALGATTCSLSGCGDRSSMKRSTCMPTNPSRPQERASSATGASSTPDDHMPPLTGARPMPCTSNPCRSRRQLKPQDSTYPGRENRLVLWGHL